MSDDRKLLIRRAGSAWIEPESSAYDNESHLQEILATDPAQIPGVDTGSLTATELLTGGGYVDVCVVGRDGSIAVVECKLASNGDRRRMVIGQVIDYAAAISMAGAGAFIQSWLHNTQTDLRVELDNAALATLRTNIADGHVDLCLAVDKIDDHLRRLVEYLNRVTIAEVRVTSLQLSYAKHGDVEILIPTTFGGEIADAKARKSGRSALDGRDLPGCPRHRRGPEPGIGPVRPGGSDGAPGPQRPALVRGLAWRRHLPPAPRPALRPGLVEHQQVRCTHGDGNVELVR